MIYIKKFIAACNSDGIVIYTILWDAAGLRLMQFSQLYHTVLAVIFSLDIIIIDIFCGWTLICAWFC